MKSYRPRIMDGLLARKLQAKGVVYPDGTYLVPIGCLKP